MRIWCLGLLKELLKKAKSKKLKISIVGFGYVGECIGAVLAENGFDVTGIDVNLKLIDAFNSGKPPLAEPKLQETIAPLVPARIRATSDFSTVSKSDLLLVTVGTPLRRDYVPDTKSVVNACESVAEHLRCGQAVVLKSTLPPLTTENVVRPILEKSGLQAGRDFYLAFCPERLAEGTALGELRTIPIVVGGVDGESTKVICELWTQILGVGTIPVSSPRVAEMSKLADNAFIDLNVALANEMAIICDAIGADCLEVIRAANSLKKGVSTVNILSPGIGVGGYCLTKDPWFLHDLGKRFGFELNVFSAGRKANDFMPQYTVRLIKGALGGLQGKRVAILGMAYKANTGDVRSTPVATIVHQLLADGASVSICDPLVAEEDKNKVIVDLPLQTLDECIGHADAIAVMAAHSDFKKIKMDELRRATPASIFVDGRNAYDPLEVVQAGFEYCAPGRGLRRRES
jgi:nucleotide sugar dehydrogenase